MKDFQSKIHLS